MTFGLVVAAVAGFALVGGLILHTLAPDLLTSKAIAEPSVEKSPAPLQSNNKGQTAGGNITNAGPVYMAPVIINNPPPRKRHGSADMPNRPVVDAADDSNVKYKNNTLCADQPLTVVKARGNATVEIEDAHFAIGPVCGPAATKFPSADGSKRTLSNEALATELLALAEKITEFSAARIPDDATYKDSVKYREYSDQTNKEFKEKFQPDAISLVSEAIARDAKIVRPQTHGPANADVRTGWISLLFGEGVFATDISALLEYVALAVSPDTKTRQ